MGSRIVATGRAVPRTALTNKDLERYMDTSDEWIRSRTGIGNRYAMRQGESLAQIATDASRTALERAGVKPSELDAIIVGTVSSEYGFPSFACQIQLGSRHHVDPRLRRRRRLLGLRLRASGRGRTDARRRFQARARGRR